MELLEKFDPRNYVRLFRFTDLPLLLDNIYCESKVDKKLLAINDNNQRTVYFPKGEFERALQEGLVLYSDKDKLKKYVSSMKNTSEKFLGFVKELKDKEISIQDFLRLCDVMTQFYNNYDKTDFMYTDLAFERGEIQKNFPEFGEFKNEMRGVINEIM